MRRTTALALGIAALLCAAARASAQGGCTGDCNNDGRVSIGELITGVNISLERAPLDGCAAFDANGDERVSIGELIGGVRFSLDGCTVPPSFAAVQQIFTAHCLASGCHIGNFPANDMSLEEGMAYEDTVGVAPFNPFAEGEGLLRVDPGAPDNSYLFLKVATALEPTLGSRMPLFADPLSDVEIQLIRDWIAAGAEP